jgi:hypothetical protein
LKRVNCDIDFSQQRIRLSAAVLLRLLRLNESRSQFTRVEAQRIGLSPGKASRDFGRICTTEAASQSRCDGGLY